MKSLKNFQIKLGLALGISILIHLALGMLFVINWEAAGQLERPLSQGIVINLSATSTTHNPTPASNSKKAIKQKSTQQINRATSEVITASAVPIPRIKPEAELSAPKPRQSKNIQTDKKQQLIKNALSTEENIAPSPSKVIASESIVNAKSKDSSIITNPVYRQWKKPIYPRRSIAKKQEGKVLVDARVDTQGRVIDLEIYKSSGHLLLDRAAVKSVKHWIFEPIQHNGIKIDAMVRIPVNFVLAQK